MTAGFSAFFDLMISGGPVMIPLFICSVAALAIILERFRNFRLYSTDTEAMMEEIRTSVKKGEFSRATLICEGTRGPIARVLFNGLSNWQLSLERIQGSITETILQEITPLERYLPTLATITRVSPLLGLLGTISGMIKIFAEISGGNVGNYEKLAAGISEALVTTATGLAIAIPCLVFHNYFTARVNETIQEMEKRGVELTNLILARKDSDES
jgi:biopolymer transport protein ExbB